MIQPIRVTVDRSWTDPLVSISYIENVGDRLSTIRVSENVIIDVLASEDGGEKQLVSIELLDLEAETIAIGQRMAAQYDAAFPVDFSAFS